MSQRTAEQQRFDAEIEAALAPIVKRIEDNVEGLAFDLREARSRIARLEHIIATGTEPLQ